MSIRSYIPVRSSQLRYYIRVPLYHEPAPGVFQLYKPPGLEISELRINEGMHPRLHIQQRDRMTAATEVHKGFNVEIARSIDTGDVSAVKSALCTLVSETLSEPRAGSAAAGPAGDHGRPATGNSSKQPGILRTFATISSKDYTTVIHSINVMALTLSFCFYSGPRCGKPKSGLGGLLHDVGKSGKYPPISSRPRASSRPRSSRS